MQTTAAKRRLRNKRSGLLSLELAIGLPILGVVIFGLFEFSLLFFARGAIVEASRTGARMASMPGVTAADVELEIRKVLSPRFQEDMRLEMSLGQQSGDVVIVAVSVPMNHASPDMLWPIGYTLDGQWLYSETRMIKE